MSKNVTKKKKRWSDNEVTQILNYIIKIGYFEKPTAKSFYSLMFKKLKIEGDCELTRHKMKNLRTRYRESVVLLNSTMLDDKQIHENIYKSCPHFDLLAQIFGPNSKCEVFEIFETSSSQNFPEDMQEETTEHFYQDLASTQYGNDNGDDGGDDNNSTPLEEIEFPIDIKPTIIDTTLPSFEANICITEKPTSSSIQKNKTLTETMSSSNLATNSCQCNHSINMTQRLEMEKRKVDLEEYKLKSNLAIDKKRLKFEEYKMENDKKRLELEEYKIKRELDLEETKIKQNMLLRQMEIEKDERIAKYEIDMKYKLK